MKNRAVSSTMPTATSSNFVRTLRNSFRRRKKPDLSEELENDENQNENNIDARDMKFTIKSNETNYQMNVRTGMANYKCKFLGKQEVDGKSGIQYTDVALRSFKTLKERNKQRIIIQITPEVIRVVSAKDRTLLFDQAVDKISFCAPSNIYPDAFSYIARDGASQRWLCYCFSAKNGITGSTLSKVFGEAFNACLENRQRLQKETGNKPLDIQFEELPQGGFTRAGNGTFRQPRRQKQKEINLLEDESIVQSPDRSEDFDFSNPESQSEGTSFSSPQSARARPAAPSHLIREASLRLPLKAQDENLFKRSTSMRAYTSHSTNQNSANQNSIPQVKSWTDQLEAIKALNIQVHNPVPVVESSPSPAWEPEDPFNELANRPKRNPYGMMRSPAPTPIAPSRPAPNPIQNQTPTHNVNNNNPFVQLDREPNFVMKF